MDSKISTSIPNGLSTPSNKTSIPDPNVPPDSDEFRSSHPSILSIHSWRTLGVHRVLSFGLYKKYFPILIQLAFHGIFERNYQLSSAVIALLFPCFILEPDQIFLATMEVLRYYGQHDVKNEKMVRFLRKLIQLQTKQDNRLGSQEENITPGTRLNKLPPMKRNHNLQRAVFELTCIFLHKGSFELAFNLLHNYATVPPFPTSHLFLGYYGITAFLLSQKTKETKEIDNSELSFFITRKT